MNPAEEHEWMLCDDCEENLESVNERELTDGRKLDLCDDCARNYDLAPIGTQNIPDQVKESPSDFTQSDSAKETFTRDGEM